MKGQGLGKRSKEVYVSVDIEADGPIPGPYSMLSLGAAAFVDYELKDQFYVNLQTLPGATMDPSTAKFWAKNQEAYDKTRENTIPPEVAMPRFVRWVESFNLRPVFVGYPAAYDFMFTYWYIRRFSGASPFSHSALDIKTMAMTMLKCGYRDAAKRAMPRRWFSKHLHTHVAIDDAVEQGQLFCNMLKENVG